MGYISGAQKIMLCQVLPGKIYRMTKIVTGCSLQSGFTSHISLCGKQLVIFHKEHIPPSYIVHYATVVHCLYFEKNK